MKVSYVPSCFWNVVTRYLSEFKVIPTILEPMVPVGPVPDGPVAPVVPTTPLSPTAPVGPVFPETTKKLLPTTMHHPITLDFKVATSAFKVFISDMRSSIVVFSVALDAVNLPVTFKFVTVKF